MTTLPALNTARDDMNQLEDAARIAASVGAEAMRTARADVLHIAAVLRALETDASEVSAKVLTSPAQRGFRDIHDGLTRLVTRAVPAMEAAAEARAGTVGRFRIAAFGRTHAGKSTLNEAMMRGDGASVSDGRTGFTRDAKVHSAGHLDVVDLPGIEAFGPDGEADERVAEQEVVAADLVLLCFDDQNQKIGEFEKVAAWVTRYQKPAIVVLNVKNEGWRDPIRLPSPKHRLNPQRAVGQHADFIRRRLSAVGLDDAPVIALSAQRALFARGRDPWRHAQTVEARRTLRERHGVDGLLALSNFPRFAAFTRALVEAGGPKLRLAALDGEVAGHARGARDTLRDAATNARKLANEVLLPQVEATSRLVGTAAMPTRDLSDLGTFVGVRSFGTPSGEIAALTEHLLLQHVGALEREALAEARRIVESEAQMGGDAFRKKVLPDAKVAAAGNAVGAALAGFVQGRLDAVKAELGSDLRALLSTHSGTSGRGGVWEQILGVAIGVGVFAGSVALLFTGLPALAVFAIGVGAFLLGLGGGWLRKRAMKKRAAARADNLAKAEAWVRGSCDTLRGHLRKHAATISGTIAKDTAVPLLHACIGLHRLGRLCDTAVTPIGAVAARRGVPINVAKFVEEARKRVYQGVSVPPGWDPAAWTLLGGDWLGLPGPMNAAADIPPDPQLARLAPLPEGSGDLELDALLAGVDPADLAALAPRIAVARAQAASRRRRIVLAGDYSSAKSSLVKRLLVAEGLPIPEGLDVKADPATAVASAYAVGDGVELVDTPGLSSGEEGHDARATIEAAGAPLGLFCVNPHLLGSQAEVARGVLAGDAKSGNAPPEGRWRFVVSRADSLGASPVDEPEAFGRVVRTKREEVARRLAAWGAESVPVHFVAADPFQRVGDRHDVLPADYAGTDGWDGIAALRAALLASASGLTRADLTRAAGRQVGHAAALRRDVLQKDRAVTDAAAKLHGQLASYIEQGATRVEGIAKGIPERVTLLLDGAASGARTRITGATNAAALRAAIDAERGWPLTIEPRLKALNEEVGQEVVSILEWVNEHLEQRLGSPLGALAAERLRATDGAVTAPADLSKWSNAKKLAAGAGKFAGEAAVRFGLDPKLLREEIKLVVGGLHKWKPWEATKFAQKLNAWAPKLAGAGRALGVAAVLLEGGLLVVEEVQRRRFEEARAKALTAIDALVKELADDVVGTHGDGFVPALVQLAAKIDAEAKRFSARAAAASAAADSLDARVASLDTLIQRAVAPARPEVTP
jgi:predicted GTPase